MTTSEVFPDLHHKMSKKIAQLTKVIYHLNTKNEDHQSEIDNLTQQHQSEVQQILRDAATRIGKFKEMIESKQATVRKLFSNPLSRRAVLIANLLKYR